MKHVFENKIEFYITNVCNLTCDNCNRFNNHKFTGWQHWDDYQHVYQQWSNYIEIKNAVIMGGEPMLNPTLKDWVVGLSQIFGCGIQILSNGTRLNKMQGLYDSLVQAQKITNIPPHIQISLHNINHFKQIKQDIKNFLGPVVEELGTIIDRPATDPAIYYSCRDDQDILVNVHLADRFHSSALKLNQQGRFTLHDSDPNIAHDKCGFARYKCYHFIRGKIYKCGPVALFPEFDQQHNLDISDSDRLLINSYVPMTVDLWPEHHVEWLEKLDLPIAQCKFCPENFTTTTIFPEAKNLVDHK